MRLTLILIALLMLVPAAAGQTWTMENADPENTGRLARNTPQDLSASTTTPLGSKVITQVVEGPAGLALTGTLDGRLVAITADGEVAFEADVPGEIRTAPLWTGEHIIVMPRASQAVALDPDGSTAWTLDVKNKRPSAALVRMASPTMVEDDVILGDLQGTVYRVAPGGGLVWTHDVGGERAIEATPAITHQGDVIVASFVPGQEGAGQLARLDGTTGEPVWTQSIGSQVVGAPAIHKGLIVLPLRDGDAVQGRSISDGSLKWSVTYDDHVTVSPTMHRNTAIAGDIRGVIRGIDVTSGEIQWTFNPLSDDPSTDSLPGNQCTVLTVADSAAVGADGRAWVPYWNANICNGFPPSDSGPSPFYLLDATNGDRLDKERYDKAAHGPALHASGVWAGSDEGLVRHWRLGTTLDAEAFAEGTNVTLVTNTDRSGPWRIDWGTEATTGEGTPPVVTHRTLDPGEHTIEVRVGGDTASTTVTVDATTDPSDGAASEGDDGTTPTDDDGSGEGPSQDPDTGTDTQDPTGDRQEDEPQGVPLGLIAPLVALALAARRRHRA